MSMKIAIIISAIALFIYFPLGLIVTPIMIAIAAITKEEKGKERKKDEKTR